MHMAKHRRDEYDGAGPEAGLTHEKLALMADAAYTEATLAMWLTLPCQQQVLLFVFMLM
jgi:hypothetical protein